MREIDSHSIRDILVNLTRWGYQGGNVEIEPVQRNAFCIRIDDSPIFTVTVTYGGALSAERERHARNEAALTEAFGPPGSVTKVELPDDENDDPTGHRITL